MPKMWDPLASSYTLYTVSCRMTKFVMITQTGEDVILGDQTRSSTQKGGAMAPDFCDPSIRPHGVT